MDENEELQVDLEFPARKPAVSALYRRQATAQERAEQAQDEAELGELWNLDPGERTA